MDEYIKFKTGKLAKDKGYNVSGSTCFDEEGVFRELAYVSRINISYCNNGLFTLAPTQTKLQKWLRVEHKIDVLVSKPNGNSSQYYICKLYDGGERVKWVGRSLNYEEAFEVGLYEGLKLIP